MLRGSLRKPSGAGDLQRRFPWAVTFFAVVIAWVFFRAKTMGWRLARCARQPVRPGSANSSAYLSPGILRVMDLPILVGEQRLLLIGGCLVVLTLAIAVGLPNVPQLFRYREYRRAPERGALVSWRPNGAWAAFAALAFAIALFGMWQRLEFLYFQF